MKRTALKITYAAVAMLATAATGSAQSMKAEIPFAFHAAGARLQPGTYQVRLTNNGRTMVQLYNFDSKRGVMTLPLTESRPAQAKATPPVLTFACTDGNCELASIRNGEATVYSFARSKAGAGTRIATVLLKSDRAD